MLTLISRLAAVSMLALASTTVLAANGQQVAVPAYISPGTAWSALERGAPTVHIAVANPESGPGPAQDPAYVKQVREAQSRRIRVLGYVHTSYGSCDIAIVEHEIDEFERWYGVDGVFLDEAANTPDKLPYYQELHRHIRKGYPHALIVLNPGAQTDEQYMQVADIILTYEGSYENYVNGYVAPAWVAHYPSSRFYHVIYNASLPEQMQQVVRLSRERNAGWVYVTDKTLPNPYGELPPIDYWNAEIDAVRTKR